MKTVRTFLVLMILIISLFSCNKEDKQESDLPKSYLDYDDFIEDGLVAYYPLNGNTEDYSGNGLNGIAHNVSYSPDRFDKSEGACHFDGNTSFISISNSALLNGNTYTICLWYRADLADTLPQSVISKSDTSGYGYIIDLYNLYHFTNFGFGFRDIVTQNYSWASFGSSWFREWTPESEQYYDFVAIAFSESKIIDYFGGNEISWSPSIFFNTNEYDLLVGMSNHDEYKNYKGELDDLLIYDRLLSYDEIETLYKWNME
jgi:hypothetical protein